jgi:hypothetical protein
VQIERFHHRFGGFFHLPKWGKPLSSFCGALVRMTENFRALVLLGTLQRIAPVNPLPARHVATAR